MRGKVPAWMFVQYLPLDAWLRVRTVQEQLTVSVCTGVEVSKVLYGNPTIGLFSTKKMAKAS